MEKCIWRITPIDSPKLAGHCAKCGPALFVSSKRFRVNANGSKLDVWLIYRCGRCGATWNLRVYSRVRLSVMGEALHQRFMQNDADLALRFAHDKCVLGQNGAAAVTDSFQIQVDGDIPSAYPCMIILQPTMPLDVAAARVLAQKLGVSMSALKRMEQQGGLQCDRGLKKTELHHPAEVILYNELRE